MPSTACSLHCSRTFLSPLIVQDPRITYFCTAWHCWHGALGYWFPTHLAWAITSSDTSQSGKPVYHDLLHRSLAPLEALKIVLVNLHNEILRAPSVAVSSNPKQGSVNRGKVQPEYSARPLCACRTWCLLTTYFMLATTASYRGLRHPKSPKQTVDRLEFSVVAVLHVVVAVSLAISRNNWLLLLTSQALLLKAWQCCQAGTFCSSPAITVSCANNKLLGPKLEPGCIVVYIAELGL